MRIKLLEMEPVLAIDVVEEGFFRLILSLSEGSLSLWTNVFTRGAACFGYLKTSYSGSACRLPLATSEQ